MLIVADAFKFIVTFRNQLNAELLTQFFTNKIADKYLKLEAVSPILRLYAAYAIERLLTVQIIRDNVRYGYFFSFGNLFLFSESATQ